MGFTRYTHASISRTNPQALGCCDRCGFDYLHSELTWQFDWAGPRLQNKRILVCQTCLDEPQEQLRAIIIPADPLPIPNARQDANMYMGQSSAVSATNNSSEQVAPSYNNIRPGYPGYAKTTALTFDSASALSVTLSNGNQTALNTGSTSASQGAKVLSAKTTSLLYYEARLAALNSAGGTGLMAGVDINADSYATASSTGSNGTFVDVMGVIWSKGSNSGYAIGSLQQGDNLGIAVNSSGLLTWFRRTPGGYWNGLVSADPETNTGGVAISSAAGVEPFVTFGGTNGSSGNAWTINTNAALFTGTMPLNFIAWSS